MSYFPSGDDRVTICSMFVDFFCTITPFCFTLSGSTGRAVCTRLLTLVAAWSGSVPMSK